jgi:hypothetical protein
VKCAKSKYLQGIKSALIWHYSGNYTEPKGLIFAAFVHSQTQMGYAGHFFMDF